MYKAQSMPDEAEKAAAAWPRVILFDLDGTLIDSVPDIAASANQMLAREGLNPLTVDEVRAMIGHGIRMLTKRVFAARGQELDDGALDYKTSIMSGIYAENLTVLTTVHDGAREILAHYRALGTKLAVVTNKPQLATETVLSAFGLSADFDLVIGDSGLPRKPEPDMLLHAVAQLGATTADTIMVGDSPADIESARAAGIASVGVRGGYTNVPLESLQPGAIIERLSDLPNAIEALSAHV
ncbi:phosphoglycolate phosphatase, bacterial [Youhaiella tibetensis]|uniref:phosphoglycolate phosphatase n=1 Tax=Paradevosia tibetensis TaxID=1447062 RepID=A0A5B9DLY6_9HYPH|nr:phosphoglycolate phosphatase [Youhaiella tibetensis]QEE19952.1 phosphoglycolate phosphatase [Youhaiella tibetensis]GGF28402.1 phosphoglycolate phosphatase, bacterial [Youhaiella tibetensis]